jgi:Predicted metal-binding integral membrane protein (DUF2182)
MAATSPWLAGGLLIVAGMFQWTPLKRACLAACRSPLSFLMTGWSEGRGGAFLMGLRHGYPVRAGLRRRQGRLGAAVQRVDDPAHLSEAPRECDCAVSTYSAAIP